MSRSLKTVKSNPLASKVKKVMQTDEDVGKIAQGAPLLLGKLLSVILTCNLAIEVRLGGAARAMELFLGKLCEGTAAVASNSHARTATPGHL